MPEPFATSGDLERRYPVDLSDDEASTRATELLAAASRLVRQRFPGIDSRTDLDTELLADVVCEMVWMAIATAPLVGTPTEPGTFQSVQGRLRLVKSQEVLLRFRRTGARASSVSNLPAAPQQRAPGTEGIYQGDGPY